MSANYITVCERIAKNAERIAAQEEGLKMLKKSGANGFWAIVERRRAHLLRMRSMLHYALELQVRSQHPLDHATA